MHTVIARYNEDIEWAKDLEGGFTVIQKGVDTINYGREPASFLLYIVTNYDKLEGEYAFRQGHPFDHWPYVNQTLNCTRDHCIHHPNLPWELFNRESGVELPERFEFHPGGQFNATAEQIKKHPKEFYQNLYDLIYKDELIAWVLERVWGVIFN